MRMRPIETKPSSNALAFVVIILVLLGVSIFGARKDIKSYLDQILKPSRHDIKNSLREAIIEDPQFFINAFREAEVKEMEKTQKDIKKQIQQNKQEIEKSDLTPVYGSDNSDITIVYFFDYNCGYCKRGNQILHKMIDKYGNLKVVYKELPILGPKSRELAASALAVYTIDKSKYFSFHDALMSEQSLKEDTISKILTTLNIDKASYDQALKNPKIREELDKINQLASKVGVAGTPALIINDDLVKGADEALIDSKIEIIRSASQVKESGEKNEAAPVQDNK
jgi:protein-disulfide isomerase